MAGYRPPLPSVAAGGRKVRKRRVAGAPPATFLRLGVDMYDGLYKPANTNVSITIDYATNGAPV
eukprot:gene4806-6745_t